MPPDRWMPQFSVDELIVDDRRRQFTVVIRGSGSIFCTQLIDHKIGRPIVILIVAYFIGAGAVFSIGFAGTTFWPIMATIFLIGLILYSTIAYIV